MKICPKCHAEVADNAKFCNVCGYSFEGAPATENFDHTSEFDKTEVSENKAFVLAAYIFGILGILLAVLVARDSAYVKFHVKQVINFYIAMFFCGFIMIVPIIGWIAAPIAMIVLAVVYLISVVKALMGKSEEMYIVRSIPFLR